MDPVAGLAKTEALLMILVDQPPDSLADQIVHALIFTTGDFPLNRVFQLGAEDSVHGGCCPDITNLNADTSL